MDQENKNIVETEEETDKAMQSFLTGSNDYEEEKPEPAKGASFSKNGVNWEYFFSLKGPAGYGARTATDSFAIAAKAKERGNDELAAKALALITSGAVMDKFHSEVFYLPPFTKDATFVKDEKLYALTSEHIDNVYVVSEFEGKKRQMKKISIQILNML